MEARQRVELTNTNRSRAYPKDPHKVKKKLTKRIPSTLRGPHKDDQQLPLFRSSFQGASLELHALSKGGYFLAVIFGEAMLRKIPFGDDGGREPRVPIPNTNVKPSSVDGTWTAGSRESRTSPSELSIRLGILL